MELSGTTSVSKMSINWFTCVYQIVLSRGKEHFLCVSYCEVSMSGVKLEVISFFAIVGLNDSCQMWITLKVFDLLVLSSSWNWTSTWKNFDNHCVWLDSVRVLDLRLWWCVNEQNNKKKQKARVTVIHSDLIRLMDTHCFCGQQYIDRYTHRYQNKTKNEII